MGSQSPEEVLSVFQCRLLTVSVPFVLSSVILFVVSFVEFPPGVAVLSLLGIACFSLNYDLCVSGDGVGIWGASCITAISRPDGSLVRGFLSSEVLAAFV